MRCLRFALLIPVLAVSVGAQSLTTVTVSGTVIDASTSMPLAGVRVTLTGIAPSIFPASSPSPVLPTSRVAVTDSAGTYQILGVTAGEYRLFVRRLGYQPALVDLDATRPAGDTRLSFGLVVVPIRLDAIQIDAARSNLFGRLTLDADTTAIVSGPAAAMARQAEFLGTDVREITRASALDAGSFGEADVLRAFQRLPGVSGLTSYSPELWVRGARWDQVRISYDGMPLFNPFHAGSGITGVTGDAIGAAFLHPGVRPVSLLAQGPSLIDLRSRAATDTANPWVASASFRGIALAHERYRPGKGGFAFSAFRSLSDAVDLPYPLTQDGGGYSDYTLRYDRSLGDNKTLEFTGLRTYDNQAAGGLYGTGLGSTSSGSNLARITLNMTGKRLRIAHTAGVSTYNTNDFAARYPLGVIDTTSPFLSAPGGFYRRAASISYATYRGDIEPVSNPGHRWQLGYQYFRYNTSSFGLGHTMSWSDLSTDHVNRRGARQYGALWAEHRWSPLARVTMNTGLRVESSLDALGVRFAPSIQARYRLDGTTNLSVGASRVFQDAQQLPYTSTTSGTDRGFWLLSGSGIPVMRADQASIGLDHWFGESILLDVNAYARRLSDVLVRPLPAGDSVARPLFLGSDVDATGVEVGLRKLAGRVTGSVGYTLGQATQHLGGASFAASGDRTHVVDALAAIRVTENNRFGAAFTFMTGAPYTRTYLGFGLVTAPDTIQWSSLPHADAPNAQRLPVYASLDLFWERSWKRAVGVFSVQNVLGRQNYTTAYARNGNQQGFLKTDAAGVPLLGPAGRTFNISLRFTF